MLKQYGYVPKITKAIVQVGESLKIDNVEIKLDYADGNKNQIALYFKSADNQTLYSLAFNANTNGGNFGGFPLNFAFTRPQNDKAITEGTPGNYLYLAVLIGSTGAVYTAEAIVGPNFQNNSLAVYRLDTI